MAPMVSKNGRTPGPGCTRSPVTRAFFVGVRGFEPPASTSRTTPNQSGVYGRVSGCADLAGLSAFAVPARVGSCQQVSDRLAPTMAPTMLPACRSGSGLTTVGSRSRHASGRYELCPRLVGPPDRGNGRCRRVASGSIGSTTRWCERLIRKRFQAVHPGSLRPLRVA